jgi:hypothetical protein
MAWKDDWGKFEEFKEWAEKGAKASPPKGCGEAATYFHHGEDKRP